MSYHAFELVVRQQIQKRTGSDDRRVLGVPAGGERVGHGHFRDPDLGHRKTGPVGQGLDDPIEPWLLVIGDEMDLVGRKRHLLGEEVGEDIERYRNEQHRHKTDHPAVEHIADHRAQYDKDESHHGEHGRRS